MTQMEFLSDTSRSNALPSFLADSLENYLIMKEIKDLYYKYEKNGYPSETLSLSVRIVEKFMEWADKNIRYPDHVLVFKDLFHKAFLLFQSVTDLS